MTLVTAKPQLRVIVQVGQQLFELTKEEAETLRGQLTLALSEVHR
jgi:hypothetical protein